MKRKTLLLIGGLFMSMSAMAIDGIENLYILGNATPANWTCDYPLQLEKTTTILCIPAR